MYAQANMGKVKKQTTPTKTRGVTEGADDGKFKFRVTHVYPNMKETSEGKFFKVTKVWI